MEGKSRPEVEIVVVLKSKSSYYCNAPVGGKMERVKPPRAFPPSAFQALDPWRNLPSQAAPWVLLSVLSRRRVYGRLLCSLSWARRGSRAESPHDPVLSQRSFG